MAYTLNKAGNHLLWHPPGSDKPGPVSGCVEYNRIPYNEKPYPCAGAVPRRKPGIVFDW